MEEFREVETFHLEVEIDVIRPIMGSPVWGAYRALGCVTWINLLVRVTVPVVVETRC